MQGWKKKKMISNLFFIVLSRLLTIVLIILPEDVGLCLGVLLSRMLLFMVKFTGYRNYMTDNVKTTFGGRFNDKESREIVKKGIENICKSLVEVFRSPVLNKKNFKKKVQIFGKANLDNALAGNKGVVLVSAHFGNWELEGAGLSLSGYPFTAVIQDQINPVVNDFLNKRRESKGIQVISRYGDLRVLLKALKQNRILGMLVDQHGESRKVFGTFFGKKVSIPEGPAVFSILSGAPILPVFVVRNSDNTHRIIIEEPLKTEAVQEKERDEKIAIISQMVNDSIEKYISLYPDHWNWMYNRWDKI
jgi:Kdo2-lipid IVA lauroyltransferase/acyltransferase